MQQDPDPSLLLKRLGFKTPGLLKNQCNDVLKLASIFILYVMRNSSLQSQETGQLASPFHVSPTLSETRSERKRSPFELLLKCIYVESSIMCKDVTPAALHWGKITDHCLSLTTS